MRKLASVQRVLEILPIFDKEGNPALSIELAVINGWQCVVKKDAFKVNDLAVYLEIDSFIVEDNPILKDFIAPLIAKNKFKFEGNVGLRVKTMKMLGNLSQGLLIPLSQLPQNIVEQKQEGDDLTEALQILKYEVESSEKLEQAGSFPEFIKKTECERIQNFGFNDFLNTKLMLSPLDITIKYDGTSLTVYGNDNKEQVSPFLKDLALSQFEKENGVHYGVCSRNFELARFEEGSNDSNRYIKQGEIVIDILKVLRENTPYKNIAIQGELIGPKIGTNFEKVQNNEFHIFNIFDIEKNKYFSFEKKQQIINEIKKIIEQNQLKYNNIFFVKQAKKIKQHSTFAELINLTESDYLTLLENYHNSFKTQNEEIINSFKMKISSHIRDLQQFLLEKADGNGYKNNYREGIVLKTFDGLHIFKAISNKFLLKEK